MTTFFELMRLPHRDEFPHFRKGLVSKVLIFSAVLLFVYHEGGGKSFFWYLAAPVIIYVVPMLGVIEHRIEKNKNK